MTFTVKVRGAGAPILAEYECPVHGRFEATVTRDANGDPPGAAPCPADLDTSERLERIAARIHALRIGVLPGIAAALAAPVGPSMEQCGLASPWRISAPHLKRDSVPCYAEVRGGDTERRPGMLDTRPLAEGMPMGEWEKKQAAAREERRHHQLIAKGLKTKRVQV